MGFLSKFQNSDIIIEVNKTCFAIEQPITINIKKDKTYTGFVLVIAVFTFMFVITKHVWSRIFLIGMASVYLYQQRYLWIHAVKKIPYVTIDNNGISYNGSIYNWRAIDKLCFRKDLTNEDTDYIIIYLESDEVIKIPMPGGTASHEVEQLAGYFKRLKEIQG